MKFDPESPEPSEKGTWEDLFDERLDFAYACDQSPKTVHHHHHQLETPETLHQPRQPRAPSRPSRQSTVVFPLKMATAPSSTLASPVGSSIADSQPKDVIVIDDDDDDEAVSVERRLATGSSPDAVVKKEEDEGAATVTNGHVHEDKMEVDDADADLKPAISPTTAAPEQKLSVTTTTQPTTAPAVVPIPEAEALQTVQIPSADDHHDQHYPQLQQAVPLPPDPHQQQQQQQQKTTKNKKPKEDSPPPQLPPRPPPIPTIRLEFFPDEESEDGYLFDVLGLSKVAGQRLPTPPPVDRDSSDSDDDDDPPEAPQPLPMPVEPLPGVFPTRRRRKKVRPLRRSTQLSRLISISPYLYI
jgi:hypothetical protein